MNEDLKLELLRIHAGDLVKAQASAGWILGARPVDPFADEVVLTRMEFLNNDPNALVDAVKAKFRALDAKKG